MTCKCQGIIGFIFGHKMEAIYDVEKKPSVISYDLLNDVYPADKVYMAEEFREVKSTYVHHICLRCGLIIKRENA